ncbi:hypothetical protein ACJX0J_034924, partial [Zea mays]
MTNIKVAGWSMVVMLYLHPKSKLIINKESGLYVAPLFIYFLTISIDIFPRAVTMPECTFATLPFSIEGWGIPTSLGVPVEGKHYYFLICLIRVYLRETLS